MSAFLSVLIKTVETLFMIGVLGSAAVLVVAMVEDVEVILNRNENPQAPVE